MNVLDMELEFPGGEGLATLCAEEDEPWPCDRQVGRTCREATVT
jgi:hypothetical protein